MKRASRTIATTLAVACALLLCTACSMPTPPFAPFTDEGTEATTTEPAQTDEPAEDGKKTEPADEGSENLTAVEEIDETETPEVTTEEPSAPADAAVEGEAAMAGTPLLQFAGIEESAQLVADMEAGIVPVKCNVLYDQMGERPTVTITDAATIAEIYDLMTNAVVIGKTDMSITDSYHHVFFTLVDGSTVGYSFEGEGILCVGRDNYAVIGTELLWQKVRALQDEFVQGKVATPATTTTTEPTTTAPVTTSDPAPEQGAYSITITDPSNVIRECPTSAKPGETVTVKTVGVADAELNVYVDEERIHTTDSMGMEWGFTMPEHDVVVRGELKPVRGGA